MKIELISVSPELAAQWLAANTENNRRKSKTTINRYASDMIRGEWKSTGDTIKFGKDGKLKDGQHRLEAIVLSKKTIEMHVARDLDNDVIHVIDTGKPRSAADALTIAGHNSYSVEFSALARKIIAHNAGTKTILNTRRIRIGNTPITNQDIVQYCAVHNLAEYVRFAHRLKYQAVTSALNHGEYAFFHWYFSQIDSGAAELFLTQLATLENVSADSPIRALIQKLTRSITTLDGKMKMHAIIATWNAWRAGEKLSVIHVGRLRQDEPLPQAI